jgi:hypothetical protein
VQLQLDKFIDLKFHLDGFLKPVGLCLTPSDRDHITSAKDQAW